MKNVRNSIQKVSGDVPDIRKPQNRMESVRLNLLQCRGEVMVG